MLILYVCVCLCVCVCVLERERELLALPEQIFLSMIMMMNVTRGVEAFSEVSQSHTDCNISRVTKKLSNRGARTALAGASHPIIQSDCDRPEETKAENICSTQHPTSLPF